MNADKVIGSDAGHAPGGTSHALDASYALATAGPPVPRPRQGSVATSSRMEIILTCGRRIVIDAGVDPEALARVIAVVDRRR